MTPRCAYLVEDGYQHAFPVLTMLRVLPAPVFTTGRQMAARFAERGAEVVAGGLDELLAAAAARGIDVLISTSQNIDPDRVRQKVPGARVVHIGHGESDKARGPGSQPEPERRYVHDPINQRFDLVLVATHEHMRQNESPHRELIGTLRHDRVLHERLAARAPEPHLVLWAPAYGRHGALGPWLEAAIAATAALGQILVIHPHPFSHRYEPALVRRLQVAVLGHRHVRLARVLDLLDLMSRATILLGDVSSASYDWLMFDRPVVFLDHDGLPYPEEKAVFAAGPVLQPGGDLAAALAGELAAPAGRSAERQRVLAERFFALDGRAGERARDAIHRWWRERWST